MEAYVKENPDLTQAKYGEHFGVSQAQICRILKALDITYKKNLTYLEQDQEKIKEFKEIVQHFVVFRSPFSLKNFYW